MEEHNIQKSMKNVSVSLMQYNQMPQWKTANTYKVFLIYMYI